MFVDGKVWRSSWRPSREPSSEEMENTARNKTEAEIPADGTCSSVLLKG
jgi:hypothetical protein